MAVMSFITTYISMHPVEKTDIRVFRKLTILRSEALLREKNPVTKCYPSGIRTQAASDFKSNTILSTLT